MKKNVLRILLALVMVSLVFALVACSGGDDKKPGGDKHTTHVDDNGDGKCDVCGETMQTGGDETASLAEEVDKILSTLSPYLNAFKNAKADSAIGIDLGIGGYFKTTGTNKSNNNFKLNVAANANAKDPELALGVSVNDEDYLRIGYKGAALYLLEGLNLINTEDTSSNKIKMDVSYLETGIKNATAVGMEYLEWFVTNTLSGLDLDDLRKGLTVKGDDGSDPLIAMADGLLTATSTANGATITVSEDNMQNIISLLKSMVIPKETWAKIDSMVNTVIGYAAKLFENNQEVYDIISKLTLDTILSEYVPSLEIRAGYDNGAIKTLDIAIVLAKLNVELGLNIDLNTLSLEEKANISFSGYNAKDLVSQVKVDLDNKGLSGVLDLVINTSNAFAADKNPIASATMKINEQAKAVEAAFDGQTVYLDMTNAFTVLGAAAPADTKFSYVIKDKDGEPTSVQNIVLNALNGLTYVAPGAAAQNAAAASGESLGIWGTIYQMLGGENASASTTMNDVIVLLNTKFGKYLKFELVDKDGKALSLEEIGAGIVTQFATVKDDLMGAVNAEGTEAGAQLFSTGESANLLDFASAFLKIPAIKTDAVTGEKSLDFNTEAEINDAATLKEYVEFVFGLYPAEGQYADYINAELIRKIVGVGYAQIIDGGIYAYAGYNAGEGLSGYVGFRANKEATENYVEVGASIGFKLVGNYATVPADISDTTDFTAITDGKTEANKGDKDYYVVFGTTWALFDAFLAYTAA